MTEKQQLCGKCYPGALATATPCGCCAYVVVTCYWLLVFAFRFVEIQNFKTWASAISPIYLTTAFKAGRNLELSKYNLTQAP